MFHEKKRLIMSAYCAQKPPTQPLVCCPGPTGPKGGRGLAGVGPTGPTGPTGPSGPAPNTYTNRSVAFNSPQSIPTEELTPIDFNNIIVDTGDIIYLAPGEFTIPTAGLYSATFQVWWAANTVNHRYIYIFLNGNYWGVQALNALGVVTGPAIGPQPTAMTLTKVGQLTAGDVLTFSVLQNSNLSVNVLSFVDAQTTEVTIAKLH